MNEEQQECFDKLLQGKNVLLTGSAGTGKSFVIKEFINNTTKHVAVTATTGVAAVLIDGTTVHSWAGIGLGTQEVDKLVRKIRYKADIKERWIDTQVLIIDEVSMLDYILLEKLEHIARTIRKSKCVFGGIQIVLCGDFCQLAPVKSDKFLFETDIFKKIVQEKIVLNKVMRQKDNVFIDCLQEIRRGKCSDNTANIISSRVGARLNNDAGIKPTILYSKNINVDSINNRELEILKKTTESRIYKPVFTKYKPYNPCEKQIELAVGAQVMMTYNVDQGIGLVNGTRGVVTDISSHSPKIRLLDGREIYVDNISVSIDKGKVSYLPLKLASAITIHRSQGSSIDYLKVSIGKDIFACGQTYTALSRARSLENMSIIDFDPVKIGTHPKVKEFYGFSE